MKISEKEIKSLLTKSKLPGCDYCINPYTGCAHKCVYCYAKFMSKYCKHDEPWGEYVDVKINAREVLQRELNKRHRPQGSVLLGSVTDAYQPVESKYKLTRSLLEELSGSDLAVSILTKSDLVLRDLDLIKQRKDWSVGFSINCLDDNTARLIEPRASAESKRVVALKTMAQAGVETFVFIGPIIPGVAKYREIIKLVASDVEEIYGEMINRRGDCVEQVCQHLLPHNKPLVAELRSRVYSERYWDGVAQDFNKACVNCGVKAYHFIRH